MNNENQKLNDPDLSTTNLNDESNANNLTKDEVNSKDSNQILVKSPIKNHQPPAHVDTLNEVIIFYLKIFSGTALFFMCRFFQQLLNISFLGLKYENPHMIDAIGLAHLYTNVLLFSFCIVCVYTLDFLGSRAFGQKNYYLYGILIHRTFITMYAILILLYIIHFFAASPFMLVISMDYQQYEYFDLYIKLFQLSYIFEFTHIIFIRYLNLIGKSYVSIIILVITMLMHVAFCYIYINLLDMVVAGAACATISTQFLNCILEIIYIWSVKPLPEVWFCFNKDSWSGQGLWDFMKVYFPLLPISMSGLWSQEIQMFIAFTLGKLNLAAHVVLQTIANIFLGISFGSSFSTVILVGFYMGKNDIPKAKLMLYVSSIIASIVVVTLVIFMIIFRIPLIKSFLNEPKVLDNILKCFPLLCVYQILEVNNRNFYNWYRAIGQKAISILVPVITYFVVQLTISLCLTKVIDLNIVGIWTSNVTAEAFSIICLLIYFFIVDIEASCLELIRFHDAEDRSRGEHLKGEDELASEEENKKK